MKIKKLLFLLFILNFASGSFIFCMEEKSCEGVKFDDSTLSSLIGDYLHLKRVKKCEASLLNEFLQKNIEPCFKSIDEDKNAFLIKLIKYFDASLIKSFLDIVKPDKEFISQQHQPENWNLIMFVKIWGCPKISALLDNYVNDKELIC